MNFNAQNSTRPTSVPAPIMVWLMLKALTTVLKHQARLFWLFHSQPKSKQA